MDQNHERTIENAREPLSAGNSGCISTELHVASEQEVMCGSPPLSIKIEAWDFDGLRAGFAHLVPSAPPLHADNGVHEANPLGALDVTISRVCAAGRAVAAGEAGHIDLAWFEGVASDLARVRDLLTNPPEQSEVPMTETPQPSLRLQQLVDEVLCTGTAGALAQSLKVMGDNLQGDGRVGYAVIARRAEQFVRAMHMHVTRFLQQPDCRLRHPTLDFDLLAAHVDVADVGRVSVHCTDTEGGGWHPFMLEDLSPAGPVDDAVRVLVAEMTRAFVQSHIGQAMERGELPGFDTFNNALEEARVNETLSSVRDDTVGDVIFLRDPEHPERMPEVHHLQVHDEYVLGEDGPHAEAVGFDPPEGDEAFGENGS